MRKSLSFFALFLCLSSFCYAHTISVDDVQVTEKDSGTANATFTLTLSAEGPGDDSVTISTANGTALFGSDYTGSIQNVFFPQGTLTQTVTITVLSDDVPELLEVFYVNLSNSTVPIADGQGQCTIIDDDGSTPNLSVDSVFLTEGDAGTIDAVLTVTLSGSPGADVTVDFTTADGTATASDYTAVTNTLTITTGNTSGTITVPIVGDTSPETNEFFFVNLSDATNAVIVQGQGTIAIVDNEGTNLFAALFEDGTLDPNWTFGNGWSESLGSLLGTSTQKKTSALATPVFAGCSTCSVSTSVRSAGGSVAKLVLLGWYIDKRNTLEIMMKETRDKWIIKLKLDGDPVYKGKVLSPILPNTDYQWFIIYDGSRLLLFLDGVLVQNIQTPFTPQGTFGFQVRGTTGTFPELIVN